MDFIGKKHSRSRSKKSAADFKVVYISSPMKVKTSASKFRSLVQKLTGQDSDAESFMELIAAADRSNLQSSAAFLDHQLLCDGDGDGDLITDRDRRFVAGKIDTAADPAAEDLILQNVDHGSFAELFHGFLHESEMPGFSSLL